MSEHTSEDAREYETLLVERRDGVAWVTMNRPEVHNAFNLAMAQELRDVWRSLRHDDAVRVAVLTGAGERAFSTGIDRTEAIGDDAGEDRPGFEDSPFHFDDPGHYVGPKSNDLWKPVIAAVNGIACGGAFYMLGEVDFIIAAEHATFFDSHVTYGMPAVFEPIHMLQKMPFHEIMRLSLLGNHERMSAPRAHQIGLVSEVVPAEELAERTEWAARAVASAPTVAVQGTVRALWSGLEHSRSQALGLGYAYVGLGLTPESLAEGQRRFASGERIEWRTR